MRRIPALLLAAGLAAAPASAVAGPSNDPWSTASSQVGARDLPQPLETVANALWSPFRDLLQPPHPEPPAWLRAWLEPVQHPKRPTQTASVLEKLRSLFEPTPAGPVCRAP